MLNITLLLAIILSVSYLTVHSIIHGIPESISGMVYTLKQKWIWSVWLASVSFLIFPSLLEALPDDFQFTAFLTIFFLCAVAALPLVNGSKNTLHYIFGFLAGLMTQVNVYIIESDLLWAWCTIPFCIIFWNVFKKYYTLIVEIVCWSMLIISVM